MPTVDDLGKKVKAKYPGQYDDLSDADVGKKVKSKYPGSYDDFTEAPSMADAATRFGSAAARQFVGGLNPMPALSAGFQAAHGNLKPAYEQFVQPQVEQFKKAGGQLKRAAGGDLSGIPGAVMYGAAGMLPGYGPLITSAVERGTPVERGGAGEVPEALGQLAGGAAVAPAMEFAGKLGKPLRKTGKSIYEGTISPSKKLPQATREAVKERGFRLRAPITKEGMEQAQGRIGVNKRVVAEATSPESLSGQKTIPNSETLSLLNKKIKQARASNDPANAEPLLKFKRDWMEKYGDEDSFLSVSELQKMKQSSDAGMRNAVFAENAETAGRKLGEKSVTQGERQGIAKAVPEVRGPNRAIHLDIELKKSINEAIKKDPKWLDHWGGKIAGFGALGAAGTLAAGHPLIAAGEAASTAVALLIRRATQDPAAMSKLAFALDKAGVKVPQIAHQVAQVAPLVTTTPPLPPSRFGQE